MLYGISIQHRKYSVTPFMKPRSSDHKGQAPGPEVIKPCSTQLSTKFILPINVKMPTIVGILTFISTINTTSERLKARNFFISWYFSFYEQLKLRAQLSEHEKSFITLGPGQGQC